MDKGQKSTSSEPIFSSTFQPPGESIFGTFSQTSQGSAYMSTSSKSAPSQVPQPKQNIFGSIAQETGESSGIVPHTAAFPSSSGQSDKVKVISHQQRSTNFSASGSIFAQNPHRKVASHEQSHQQESAQSTELKRKQAFMKKMISQSIFGAKHSKVSLQATKKPVQERTAIQKRPFDASLPAEDAMAKRRSLRDMYPVKAAVLGRKKSFLQEQQAIQEEPTSSSRMEGAVQTIRRRQLSSGLAEQVATLTSIICHEVPDNMNNESTLHQYFGKFGDILKISSNRDKRTATIGFKTHEMAAAAKAQGFYDHETNTPLKIFYLKRVRKSLDKNLFQVNSGSQALGLSQQPRIAPQSNVRSSQPPIFATNDSEKLAILEKIDSLLRKQIVRQSDINKAKTCKGTCVDMCPEKERYLRQERKILAIYETKGDLVDHARAVKEYSRSSADQEEPLPHELRPSSVLEMTMHYLLYDMMPRLYQGQIADWYDFLWNRSRAIRKELSVQQICNITAVHINEQCARFHIFCAHELSGQDRMVFDPKINNENLEKTMKTVMDLYQDLYFSTQNGQANLPLDGSNVAELFSYYILLNINRTADVLNEFQDLPQAIRYDGRIALAMDAFMALHSNNYVKFFKVVRQATFLQGCILHRYFMQVRKKALDTISKAFSFAQKTKTFLFPAHDIIRILNFNDIADLQSFSLHFGIPLNSDGMLELTRAGPHENEGSAPLVPSDEVKRKLENRNIAEVIANCSLKPILHQPYSSFDRFGKYIGEHSSLLASARNYSELAPSKPKKHEIGINMLEVRNVAKQLFLEVIDELCLSVANLSHIEATANISFVDLFEEIVRDNIIDISTAAIIDIREQKLREELQRKKLEQDRKRREILEREEKRKRELKILEEKRELERMKKKKEMELMQLTLQIFQDVCATVVTFDIKKLVSGIVRDEKFQQWSNEEFDAIKHVVVSQDIKDICKSVWRKSKLKVCMKIKSRVLKLRLKRYFRRWQDRKLLQLRFKILTQTFPTVPIFRVLKTQVHELLPKQPEKLLNCKAESFPLDPKHTVSLQTPMEIVQRQMKFTDILKDSASATQKKHDDASRLPLCTMLHDARRQYGLQDESMKWKISLRIPTSFVFSNNTVESWLLQLFFPDGKSSHVFSDTENICISCQRISDENTQDDLFGSFSVVLCLSKPSSDEPDREYWDSVRKELEILVCNRLAMPAIPLLVISFGWECCEELLNSELGFSLLSFAFSRWAICTVNDNCEYILDNYISIKSGVQFLFEEMPLLPNLTSTSLRELVEDILLKEYVLPVSQYSSICKKLFQTPMVPSVLIRFYNFIIESLANIISSHRLSEISWSPVETISDCEKSIWNGRWNNEQNLIRTYETAMKCKLPPFPIDYEVTTGQDISRAAVDYGKRACPNCPAIASIINDRLNSELHIFANEIYLDDSFYSAEKDVFKLFDWHSILDIIICQHLTDVLYQQSEVGDMIVTFLTEDLETIEKFEEFEKLKRELDHVNVTLVEPKLAETAISVRPQFSEIIDDQFSHLDYSIPSPNTQTSLTDDTSDTTVADTMKLLQEAKLERELSSITTEHLGMLASEIEMAL